MAEDTFSLLADLETLVGKTAGLAQSLYYLMEPAGPMDADERAAIMWVVSELRHSAADANEALNRQLRYVAACRQLATKPEIANRADAKKSPEPVAARLRDGLDRAEEVERRHVAYERFDTARTTDLSKVDTDDLACLCDGLRVIDDVIVAVACQPRSKGFPEELLDSLSNQVGLDMGAIIDELSKRPRTDHSAETMILHELRCEGIAGLGEGREVADRLANERAAA